MQEPIRWAYGITTVPERAGELFPRTLKSLAIAGFDDPRLFIDADTISGYSRHTAEMTTRSPRVKTAANWLLAAWELYLREPTAHRFAVFQDDIVASRNLRRYLDKSVYPEAVKGYWNLCTYPVNDTICPEGYKGWYLSNQYHKGAQALVFSREAIQYLLSNLGYAVQRSQEERYRHQCIDGTVGRILKEGGWMEYVHNPSLVCHTGAGDRSSMTPFAPSHKAQPVTESFRGEDFDLLTLLR